MVWIIGAICMIVFGTALFVIGFSVDTLSYAIAGGVMVVAGIFLLRSMRRSRVGKSYPPRLNLQSRNRSQVPGLSWTLAERGVPPWNTTLISTLWTFWSPSTAGRRSSWNRFESVKINGI